MKKENKCGETCSDIFAPDCHKNEAGCFCHVGSSNCATEFTAEIWHH